jgi:hemolysin III
VAAELARGMQPNIAPFIFRTPVSASTHMLWCLLGMYVTGLLWRLARGDRIRQLSVGCFGLSMTLLYGASAIYHAFPNIEPYLDYFRLLDHSAIYVLIAGSFTPVCAVLLRGKLRITLFILMWSLAFVGIACKWLLPAPSYWVTVSLYIALGWLGVIPVYQLVKAVGYRGMAWALLGGILYSLGGIFDAIRWPILWPHVIEHHEVLHLCDMGGTLAHIFFVIRYVLPYQR